MEGHFEFSTAARRKRRNYTKIWTEVLKYESAVLLGPGVLLRCCLNFRLPATVSQF